MNFEENKKKRVMMGISICPKKLRMEGPKVVWVGCAPLSLFEKYQKTCSLVYLSSSSDP